VQAGLHRPTPAVRSRTRNPRDESVTAATITDLPTRSRPSRCQAVVVMIVRVFAIRRSAPKEAVPHKIPKIRPRGAVGPIS